MARPAFARVFGEWEERREDVEAVSAASSAERRESWVLAKAEGSSGGSGFRRSIFLGGSGRGLCVEVMLSVELAGKGGG